MLRAHGRLHLAKRRRAVIRRGSFAFVLLGLVVVCASANAQTEAELARARAQFDEALSLEVAEDFKGALAKLNEVAKVRQTPQVRFHIARCKERLQRYTEALGDYQLAEHAEPRLGPEDLAEVVRARESLQQRIPRLSLVLPKPSEGVEVELDGVLLGAARLREPVLVDPGTRHIVVTNKHGRLEESVEVSEGETREVSLRVPEPAKPPAPPPQPPVSREKAEGAPPSYAYVAGGIGLAGVLGAAVFAYLRADAEQTLDDECIAGVCPERLRSTQTMGERASVLAPVSLGVGLVGLAVAGYGFLSPREAPAQPGFGWSLGLTQERVGVELGARF